jgi:hypothetical protein
MTPHQLTLLVLPDLLAVCRLAPDAATPTWAASTGFSSITRTSDELSIVCRQEAVPEEVKCERGWRCLGVAGTIDFAVVGVLASLVTPLAEAGIFEKQSSVKVKTVAVGTGQALQLGQRGDADVLLVHDPAAEEKFMAGGYGVLHQGLRSTDHPYSSPVVDLVKGPAL